MLPCGYTVPPAEHDNVQAVPCGWVVDAPTEAPYERHEGITFLVQKLFTLAEAFTEEQSPFKIK